MTQRHTLPDSQPPSPKTIGDLALERYHLGELPASEAEAIRLRLSTDASLRERLQRIVDQEQSFAKSHPAEQWVPKIEKRIASPGPNPAKPRSWVHPHPSESQSGSVNLFQGSPWNRLNRFFSPMNVRLASGFALVLLTTWIALPPWMNQQQGVEETVRLKGKTAELKLYLKVGPQTNPKAEADPRSLRPGDTVHAGDALQIEFHPGIYRYGAIVSVDGRGSVTWHWPSNPLGNTDVTLLPGHLLPQAFQLDSAPAFERFYLILSRDSLQLDSMGERLSASIHQPPESWAGQEREGKSGLEIHAFPLVKAP